MNKEQIIKFLETYDYNYSVQNNKITINLELSQRIYIELIQENKIKISDELVGWNFLTGLMKMNLKSAIIYNSICALIFGIVTFFVQLYNSTFMLIPIFLILCFGILLFTIFYLIKLESFKSRITNLTN